MGSLPRIFTFAFLALLTALSIHGQTSPELKLKTFEKVWKTVNDGFYDPNFNGVNWKAVHDRYAPRIDATKTEAEFYDLLDDMLAELKVSHMEILKPEDLAQLKKVTTTTGLGLRAIDGQVVVTRILPDSSAAKAGLKTGFVVTGVNGQPVKTLQETSPALGGPAGSTLKLSYLNENDQPAEATLERVGLSDENKGNIGAGLKFYFLFASERLRNNIGYFRFSSFVGAVSPQITAAIESMKDAPGIIIDLRGNGGGDDEVAIKMANMLFDKETQLMITRTRKGDDMYYKAKPVKNPYRGPVVILVDEFSGSASEQFTAGMQEAGRAYVIGKTTEGDDMDADLAKLPTGAYLIYATGQPRTPKGVVIEGRGVIPDKEVSLTRKELLAGQDAQLEAAIQYIESRKKPDR
jgi:carboxyl-terminal processing protease